MRCVACVLTAVMTTMRANVLQRWLPFAGGLLAAASVALSAYAAHGAQVAARGNLQLAAVFAFGHGLALAALGARIERRLGRFALAAWLPGVLLIAGWLLYAVDALRR